jgi:hypothetical protein
MTIHAEDTSELYYAKRDEFVRYCLKEVNPAREEEGLELISESVASACYRIIDDFNKKWNEK